MSLTRNTVKPRNQVILDAVNAGYSDHPHNAAWLGTLSINGKPAQVQLVVTQDANAFIDEN